MRRKLLGKASLGHFVAAHQMAQVRKCVLTTDQVLLELLTIEPTNFSVICDQPPNSRQQPFVPSVSIWIVHRLLTGTEAAQRL